MRSDLVFRANAKIINRFELCHMASRSARTLSRNSVAMHDSINEALTVICTGDHQVVVVVEQPLAPLPTLDVVDLEESVNFAIS
jgi:hypothetical protein